MSTSDNAIAAELSHLHEQAATLDMGDTVTPDQVETLSTIRRRIDQLRTELERFTKAKNYPQHGMASADQIAAWERQHGSIFTMTAVDEQEPAYVYAYFREWSLEDYNDPVIYRLLHSREPEDAQRLEVEMAKRCWLGGDARVNPNAMDADVAAHAGVQMAGPAQDKRLYKLFRIKFNLLTQGQVAAVKKS